MTSSPSAAPGFGPTALLVVAACVAGALLPERLWGPRSSLRDGSAAITGILLALTLPPGIPLWMAFVGGAFGVVFGKLVFGGLGQNVFNPALLGRAFLQAAFPTALTTWTAPGSDLLQAGSSVLAVPLGRGHVETVPTATPLGLASSPGRSRRGIGSSREASRARSGRPRPSFSFSAGCGSRHGRSSTGGSRSRRS